MKHLLALVPWCLGLLVSTLALARGADEDPLKTRFDKEAVASWTRIRQALDGWEGKVTHRNTRTMPGQEPRVFIREMQYARRGPLTKTEMRNVSEPGYAFIRCTNESYKFSLEQKSAQDRFHVDQYAPLKKDDLKKDLDMDFLAAHIFAAVRISGWVMPTGLEEGSLRVVDLRPVAHEGRPMARLQIEWGPPRVKAQSGKSPPESPPAQKPEMWAIVDPSDGWIVHEWHVKGPWGENNELNEFVRLENNLPFPRKLHEVNLNQEGKVIFESDWTFETPRRCDEPPSAFHLSAFGLHEAKDWRAPYGRADLYTVLAVNASVILILGAGAYLLRRIKHAR